jgi:CPA1 family monovalent cation:H+ antiporter
MLIEEIDRLDLEPLERDLGDLPDVSRTAVEGCALALPTSGFAGSPFPYRDLIVFTAFSVVLGTLVVQGMTLRPLINALHLEDDGWVERETRLAPVEVLRAGLLATAGPGNGEEISGLLRHRYEVMLRRAEAEGPTTAIRLPR